MNERRYDRRKQTEKRQYNADGIHADCSPKVKHNYAIAALADREHFHETREITGHKRNVGGFQRDIAALSHRDTHRGFSQCGRIVHAIADHCHFAARTQQLANFFHFLPGQKIADRFIDAQFGSFTACLASARS